MQALIVRLKIGHQHKGHTFINICLSVSLFDICLIELSFCLIKSAVSGKLCEETAVMLVSTKQTEFNSENVI